MEDYSRCGHVYSLSWRYYIVYTLPSSQTLPMTGASDTAMSIRSELNVRPSDATVQSFAWKSAHPPLPIRTRDYDPSGENATVVLARGVYYTKSVHSSNLDVLATSGPTTGVFSPDGSTLSFELGVGSRRMSAIRFRGRMINAFPPYVGVYVSETSIFGFRR